MLATRRTIRPSVAIGLAALALTTAACGSSDTGSTSTATEATSLDRLEITAPAAPGGGWDSTSRAAQEVLRAEGLAKAVQVVNVPGAGGTIGLAKLANDKGKSGKLMTMGLVMVGAIETNKSATTLDDVTPIARLTSEQEAIVVPASSPYKTLEEFVAAWKTDPGKLAIAGGSAGGTDQILAGLVAQAGGIDDADKEALSEAVQKMHDSGAWKAQMEKNGWDDAFQPADEFTTFLADEKTRVSGVLKSLGLV